MPGDDFPDYDFGDTPAPPRRKRTGVARGLPKVSDVVGSGARPPEDDQVNVSVQGETEPMPEDDDPLLQYLNTTPDGAADTSGGPAPYFEDEAPKPMGPPTAPPQLRQPTDPSWIDELGHSALSYAEGASMNTVDELTGVGTWAGQKLGLIPGESSIGEAIDTSVAQGSARNAAREYPLAHLGGAGTAGVAGGAVGGTIAPARLGAQMAIQGGLGAAQGAGSEYADSRDPWASTLAGLVGGGVGAGGATLGHILGWLKGLSGTEKNLADLAEMGAGAKAGPRGLPPPVGEAPPIPQTPRPVPTEYGPAYDPRALRGPVEIPGEPPTPPLNLPEPMGPMQGPRQMPAVPEPPRPLPQPPPGPRPRAPRMPRTPRMSPNIDPAAPAPMGPPPAPPEPPPMVAEAAPPPAVAAEPPGDDLESLLRRSLAGEKPAPRAAAPRGKGGKFLKLPQLEPIGPPRAPAPDPYAEAPYSIGDVEPMGPPRAEVGDPYAEPYLLGKLERMPRAPRAAPADPFAEAPYSVGDIEPIGAPRTPAPELPGDLPPGYQVGDVEPAAQAAAAAPPKPARMGGSPESREARAWYELGEFDTAPPPQIETPNADAIAKADLDAKIALERRDAGLLRQRQREDFGDKALGLAGRLPIPGLGMGARGLQALGRMAGKTQVPEGARDLVMNQDWRGATQGAWSALGQTGASLAGGAVAPAKPPVSEFAYAGADTLKSAVQSVLTRSEGISEQTKEAMTRAVLSGNTQSIAAADFQAKQRDPVYARQVEAEHRALNDRDGGGR